MDLFRGRGLALFTGPSGRQARPVSISFLLTTLIVVATPGTGVIFTLSAGISRGRRASVLAAFACTLGIVPHLAATITGLAALLHASPVAFQVVKYLGVAYLLYMAIATLRDKDAIVLDDDGPPRSAARVVVSGVLINVLNPKLTMFFVAFLPQFVGSGSVPAMLALSAVFMLATFVVFAAYGIFAAAVRDHVTARPGVLTWLRRAFAASFVALGAKLALAGR
jgi:threonine/homoserine/homoserine lactone efflux protein